jgi:hypothetical protein
MLSGSISNKKIATDSGKWLLKIQPKFTDKNYLIKIDFVFA